MRSLDPATLDPGIRDVVVALRAAGFGTCDSGDGSKRGEGTLPFPHVAVVEVPLGVDVNDKAAAILDVVKATDKREGWIVEASYSTADGVLMFVVSLPGAEVVNDDNADRLFAEGERDAALHDLAVASDHLAAANSAHLEAERELAEAKERGDADRLIVKALAEWADVRGFLAADDALLAPVIAAAREAVKVSDGADHVEAVKP